MKAKDYAQTFLDGKCPNGRLGCYSAVEIWTGGYELMFGVKVKRWLTVCMIADGSSIRFAGLSGKENYSHDDSTAIAEKVAEIYADFYERSRQKEKKEGALMDKYNINGVDYVRLKDICDIIRMQREAASEHDAQVLNRVVRTMFCDELKAAKTDEEKDAIMELPGDFVVIRKDEAGEFEYFSEWRRGDAIISRDPEAAMYYEYESMANSIAEQLGEGWEVFNTGTEAYRARQRLLDAIFGEE